MLVQSDKNYSTIFKKHYRIKFSCHTEWDILSTVAQVDHQIKAEAKSRNNYKDGKITHDSSGEI